MVAWVKKMKKSIKSISPPKSPAKVTNKSSLLETGSKIDKSGAGSRYKNGIGNINVQPLRA